MRSGFAHGSPPIIITLIEKLDGTADRLWCARQVTQQGDSYSSLQSAVKPIGRFFPGGAATRRLIVSMRSLIAES